MKARQTGVVSGYAERGNRRLADMLERSGTAIPDRTASWMGELAGSGNHDYKTIRKAQENVTNETAQTYLCSISDAGEQRDIHPKNKKIVGERLALLARGTVYNEDILCSAPIIEKIEGKEQKIVL